MNDITTQVNEHRNECENNLTRRQVEFYYHLIFKGNNSSYKLPIIYMKARC